MVTQCTAEALPLSSPGADVIRFDTDRTQDPDGRRPADPAVTAAAERNRRRLGYLATKRAFDILISSLALVVLSPLYAALAMAIRIDSPGPAIFSQERVGQDGRPFTMYKFRSMYQDAEERLADLRDRNEKDGPVFKIADDPRITRVGSLIRKTSLDELPQFLNVLRGDISIVGPRPALPSEVAQYDARQRQRLLCPQGITCFWQTRRDRDSITFDEWVDLDLLYIKKCSVLTDLKLMVQTAGVMLTIDVSQNLGLTILQVMDRYGFRARMYLLAALINVVGTFLLARAFAGYGAAVSSAIAITVSSGVVLNAYYARSIRLRMGAWWSQCLREALPLVALGGACALLWDHIPHATSWGALVLGILAFAAAFCLVAWFLCANAYERGLAAKALSRIARRGPRSRHDKPKHMAR